MKSFFEINKSVLQNKNPLVYSKIAASDLSGINVFESKTGEKVPEISINNKKIFIHSRYDPQKEAERFISEIDTSQFNLFIVFGFGFAYHIEELFKRIEPNSTVLVFEKHPAIIRAAIENRDLSTILNDPRIFILIDPDEDTIAETLRGKSTYKVSLVLHRGSYQLDPEYYNNRMRISKSYLSAKEVNIATLAKFEKTWASNIARNIMEFISNPGANIFYNKFSGVPAIVVAAGPSLSKSMDFIRKNSGRAVIIAVDTSYMILKKYGIEPHFCLSVDPQLINARYFEGNTSGAAMMVADPTVHPSVFHLFKGKRVICSQAFQMMKWVEDASGVKGELAYGGSVSTNAYDFAKRIGASPVIMVGQDLAFTSSLAHARGSYLDEQIFKRTSRFYNPLMFNRFQLTALPAIYVRGILSARVHTNQKMMIFLSWFQKRNDPDLINCTYDGAYISGINHVPQDEITLEGEKRDIPGLVREIYEKSVHSDAENASVCAEILRRSLEMYKEIDVLTDALERAVRLSGDFQELANSGKRDQGKLDYIFHKLSEVDKLVESKTNLKDMIGFTIQRVIHTITEGYDIDEQDQTLSKESQVAKRSLFLYQGLLDGCLFNKRILEKMMTMLER